MPANYSLTRLCEPPDVLEILTWYLNDHHPVYTAAGALAMARVCDAPDELAKLEATVSEGSPAFRAAVDALLETWAKLTTDWNGGEPWTPEPRQAVCAYSRLMEWTAAYVDERREDGTL